MEDRCEPSKTGEHEWRPYLSGGYKCVHCGQEWVPAEPCVDPGEINSKSWAAAPEPLWPKLVGIIVAVAVIASVFGTVGVGK
jgi:hypothetical protein